MKYTLTFLFLLSSLLSFAQNIDSEQQYKVAMQNAKSAFDAKMYSEALFFYKEALQIKPEAKLPKYKIEDIRTIYINDELKENNNPTEPQIAKQEAENKADLRIEKEIQQAQEQMENIRIVATIEINDTLDKIEEDFIIEDIARTEFTTPKKLQPQDQPTLPSETKEAEIHHIKPKQIVEEPTPKKDTIIQKPKPSAPKPTPRPIVKQPNNNTSSNTMTIEEKEKWKAAEIEKLRKKYPNKKTIEEIDQPGKHITRTIINTNDNIFVYLKVKHSWGATFFFIDNIGEELKSINEQTYNQLTNLDYYGD